MGTAPAARGLALKTRQASSLDLLGRPGDDNMARIVDDLDRRPTRSPRLPSAHRRELLSVSMWWVLRVSGSATTT